MSDQELPEQFSISIDGESIPFTMHAEVSTMTMDEAVASGWFDLPDEPGMVRIPVSIDVMIPNHILFPSRPPEEQHDPDGLYDMVEDDSGYQPWHAAAAVTQGFGMTIGPVADAEEAAFRKMLKVIQGGRGQGFPTLPVAEPIETTDIELPRIVVDGAPSGDAPNKQAAAAEVARYDTVAQAHADSGGGDGPGPAGSSVDFVDLERWAKIGAAAGGGAGVVVGGLSGGAAGAAAGAAGGTLVVPGVGTIGGAVAGAAEGAVAGAAIAGAAGVVVGGEAGRLAGELVHYIQEKDKPSDRQGTRSGQQTKSTSDNPSPDPKNKSREDQVKDIQKDIDEFKKILNKEHHDASRREQKGEIVKINPRDGEPFDHENEVEEAWSGLQKTIRKIKNRLGYPYLGPAERAVLMDQLGQASRALDDSKRFVRGGQ